MPLKNRRSEYSWPSTTIEDAEVATNKRTYSIGETVVVSLAFKVRGGLREAFHPDVWTVAWEDFDKIMRLTMAASIGVKRGVVTRKVAEAKKRVRRASFYWSRDPDLPYRVWAMIVPEDGGPPIIPRNVEDAKSKMLDVEKTFEIPAEALGKGRHSLVGQAKAKWGRRSFIEKGSVSKSSKPVVIEVG